MRRSGSTLKKNSKFEYMPNKRIRPVLRGIFPQYSLCTTENFSPSRSATDVMNLPLDSGDARILSFHHIKVVLYEQPILRKCKSQLPIADASQI